MMPTVVAVLFWICAGLLVYTQAGYPLLLALLGRVLRGHPAPEPAPDSPTPLVSLIVAAHAEEAVIAGKVANALAADWPRDALQVIVACDGSPDRTAQLAREAGADLVLELPRGGKVRAQDTAVTRARGGIVAFSDANALWEPGALRELVAPFAEPDVGYVCGQVRFVQSEPTELGDNQEGVYWRYEMAVRALESRLASVTAGNGAIYAVRRAAYEHVDERVSHDLSFPFTFVKKGLRAVYAPRARATEKMVPSIDGEFARKRRMMSHAWPVVLRGRLLSPRGYPPLYALMIYSHRLLRYAAPFLHAAAFGLNAALLTDGVVYVATFVVQCAVLVAALLAGVVRDRVLLVARYYVATNASIALGLFDYLTKGTPATWETAEGAR